MAVVVAPVGKVLWTVRTPKRSLTGVQYLWGTSKVFYQRRQCEADVIAACLKYFFRSDEEFAVGEMQKAADGGGGGGCDHETDGERTDAHAPHTYLVKRPQMQ